MCDYDILNDILPLRNAISARADHAHAIILTMRRPSHRLAIGERGRSRQRLSKTAKALEHSGSRRALDEARVAAVRPLCQAHGDIFSSSKAAQCWPMQSWHRVPLAGLLHLHQLHYTLPKSPRAARALKLRGFGLWLVDDTTTRWFGWLRMHVCHAGTRQDGC